MSIGRPHRIQTTKGGRVVYMELDGVPIVSDGKSLKSGDAVQKSDIADEVKDAQAAPKKKTTRRKKTVEEPSDGDL